MQPPSTIDASMLEAYRGTNFNVNADQSFTLKVGKCSAPLHRLYHSMAVQSAAFITAWNPYSKALTTLENKQRNSCLIAEVNKLNLQFINGVGQDPEGKWPGEESILILGIELEEARRLGRAYEQNAILWCDSDALPHLILLV
jgi:hypothetical protein